MSERQESKNFLTPETKSFGTDPKPPSMENIKAEKNYLTLEPGVNTPTIIMSSTTPPSISPTLNNLPLPGASMSGGLSPVGSPSVHNTPSHPLLTTRRDSTTQCYYGKGKEVSSSKLSRLTRQAATIDESPSGRRSSQPTLSPDPDDGGDSFASYIASKKAI